MDWCNGKLGFCWHDERCGECGHFNGEGLVELSESLYAYIRQLEAQAQRWISVEDRLPEESEDVLVFCRNDNITWNTIAHRVRTLWWRSGVPIESITHWMPLPEPPEEEV